MIACDLEFTPSTISYTLGNFHEFGSKQAESLEQFD